MKRLRDLALYLVIGIAAVIAAFAYQEHFGNNTAPVAKWGGLVGMTAVLFGYAANSYKAHFGKPKFWSILACLLLIHVAVFVTVFRYVEQWKVMWFVLLFPIENIIIDATIRFFVRGKLSSARTSSPLRGPRLGPH